LKDLKLFPNVIASRAFSSDVEKEIMDGTFLLPRAPMGEKG
jgi:hypothetical protein